MRSEFQALEAAFDKLPPVLTSNKALIVNSAGSAVSLTTGDFSLAGNFATAGAYSMTLTSTGATNVTLPTTGTLATLAGSEALTNKTINGSLNTLSNIGNSSLVNSSVTINGSSVALGGSITVSTASVPLGTSLTGGTSGYILYDNAGTLGELATTGTGNVVRATSPSLTTPNLGTPSAATLTNATGLPIDAGTTGTLPVGRGGTGVTSTPSSNQLLVGNGTGYSLATLTAGSNVSITNSGGALTISSTAAPSGVTAVANGGTGLSSTPSSNQLLVGNGTGYSLATLTAGSNVTITNSGGALTISSSAAPSGITTVANGGTGLNATPVAGQLLIGTGTGYSLNTLTAGTGITITNTAGGITIASSGASGVTSTVNGGTGLSSTPSNNQILVGNGSGYDLNTLSAGANMVITKSGGLLTIATTATTNTGTITGVSGTGTAGGLTLSGSGTSGAVTLTLSGTVTAAAGSLTGSTLNSTVTSSSLTSVGTLSSLAVSGATTHTGTTTFNGNTTFSATNTISSGGSLLVQTSTSQPGYGNTSIGGSWLTDGTNGPSIFLSRANNAALSINSNSDSAVAAFYKGGVIKGYIAVNADATVYSTTSDYRLKENFEPLTGALTRLQDLNVYRFNWKASPERPKVDGFVAHEVSDVVPEAITGEKDAVNEDGSIKPQGIDQSKLVPLLTAALQEAIAEINALKTRVAALEAA